MAKRRPSTLARSLTRRPRLPLLTALSTLVAATVLARPTALVTFGLIALAGTLNSKRHPQGRIMR
ncbi:MULTISPECIES: hypothetical protein [unclassified Synechococcus]|jgi:hypothetical protein|uniref:hypothetical protein n=1 Tax=unclassified Synechococcus TaxID=2626047 RepID=UPI000B706A0A|nr:MULTISPECIES: hypothetical protein [unclassified Synechococcus]MAS28034.1 hypothetical protein [Synechococcus sp. NAT40]OUW46495.1 MAG: hypothetical protein CBD47_06540 [Synechococcus sp. TMED187]RZO10250.1 MAG: hypothetical protein EVB08_10395 [Synechococcus sp. MED-G135]